VANTKVNLDFGDTESRGGKKGRGTRPYYPAGDYAVQVKKAAIIHSAEKQTPGILVDMVITSGKHKGKPISDTLWLTEKSLWKVRQAMEAMGLKVPSKKVSVDVTKFKGKELAITLDDEEYNDKVYSRVVDFFLLSELDLDEDDEEEDDEEEEEDDEDTEDEEDEEEEDEEPAPKKKAKKGKKAKSDDDDDDLEGLDLEDI
jgi:hypothetical protein